MRAGVRQPTERLRAHDDRIRGTGSAGLVDIVPDGRGQGRPADGPQRSRAIHGGAQPQEGRIRPGSRRAHPAPGGPRGDGPTSNRGRSPRPGRRGTGAWARSTPVSRRSSRPRPGSGARPASLSRPPRRSTSGPSASGPGLECADAPDQRGQLRDLVADLAEPAGALLAVRLRCLFEPARRARSLRIAPRRGRIPATRRVASPRRRASSRAERPRLPEPWRRGRGRSRVFGAAGFGAALAIRRRRRADPTRRSLRPAASAGRAPCRPHGPQPLPCHGLTSRLSP